MKDFSNEILAYGLQNALEFGKVDAGRVLPKLFQHGLDKKDIKNVMPDIQKIVKKINGMSAEERVKAFADVEHLIKKHEEKEKDLPSIDIKGIKHVVTRMVPEPSKYAHVGHALTFLINYLYAEKYKGTCVLRLEDANPEKVAKEYADALIEDIRDYLGIPVKKVHYVSDHMKEFYGYAEKLIKQGNAFMCFCNREKLQELRHSGTECECRQFTPEIQLGRWKLFVKGEFAEGEAVLRLKGDMQSTNHVMRDPALFRRIDAKHYRHGTKYKVWPLYDFYNPVEDSLMGVTLILRSNEFDTRVELQDRLKEVLGLKKQTVIHYGRFNVADFTTKGREIREMFESGELKGWDDPRLITLRALKRRGIVKEAFYELVKQIGLSKHPVTLEFDMIAAINRKIIDPHAPRYYFVREPVELAIGKQLEMKSVDVPVHPDTPEQTRTVALKKLFISKEDYTANKGKEVRLLHLCNVKLSEKPLITSFENKKIPRVQWVSDNVPVRVLMPDGTWTEGVGEKALSKLKKGTLLQFERFGFVRYDQKTKDAYEFWFTHA